MTAEEFKLEAQTIRLRLVNQARRYLGDADEAEDVVQDALLRLWQMHSELQAPMLPMATIVTRNLAIDHCRRRQHLEPLIPQAVAEEPSADERTERILAIIDTLPTMQQTILRLRHMEGLEMSDIAKLTGSTEAAVRKALSRARQAVRDKYYHKKVMWK